MTSSEWIPSLSLGSASKLPCVGPRYPQQQHVHTPSPKLKFHWPSFGHMSFWNQILWPEGWNVLIG